MDSVSFISATRSIRDILLFSRNLTSAINLHPALLPKFGGEGMWGHHVHEAVLAAGETESGCTIHLVDAGCDTGEILLQKRVPVLPGDTPESLYARIAPQEHLAMVEGVELLAQRLRRIP